MNTLICQACKDTGRVSRPISVEYIDRRSGERQFLFCCSLCDHVDGWPVFSRTSPPLTGDKA